jgi:hypothetical protein
MTDFRKFKAAKPFTGASLRQYSPRGLLMYCLALALIPAVVIGLIKGHVTTVIVNSVAFTLYVIAAGWLRKGLRAENPEPQSRLQNPSRWPFKLLAAALVAVNTGLLTILGLQQSLAMGALYAGGAFLGMYLSYGFDRREQNSIPAAQGYSGEEIRKTLADALAVIQSIEEANRSIGHAEFNRHIERICDIAAGVIADLEADPRGIRRARKFLNIYLENVQQVVQGYAKTHQQISSEALEQNFRQALQAIESAFSEQRQKLLEEDMFDLDVKIEVLTAQLKREGIM